MTVVPLGPDAGAGRAARRCAATRSCACSATATSSGGGVEVEFFGERTTLPGGPATLALRTGAPLLPTAVYFTDRATATTACVRPPLAARAHAAGCATTSRRITQLLADELEVLIRRAPEQWHLFQPNWPSDPGYGH